MKLEKNIFNMNTYSDKIDSYLLDNMSEDDKTKFENELSSNDKLKEDLEFTTLVRDEIKDRNEKLRFIQSVKAKKSRSIKLVYSITGIAAAIIMGLFIITPNNSVLPVVDVNYYSSYRAAGDILKIADLINEGKYKEALTAIEQEQNQVSDELNIIMESTSDGDNSERIEYESQLAKSDLYELAWLKANALIGTKDYKQASEILEQLQKEDGPHKKEASELLKKIK